MNIVQSDIQSIVSKGWLFEPFVNSRFLITGATGLIGSMTAKTLLEANRTYGLNIRIIGQIRNQEKAEAVFGELLENIELTTTEDVLCDYIIHTASPTASRFFVEHPVETIKTAISSTSSMLELAKNNGATMLYLSSMEEYGVPYETGQRMTEDNVGIINHLDVRSSYSESKRLCECLCASYVSEYDVNVKIARLAQTFGSGVSLTDHRMPVQFAKAAIMNNDIILHTEGKSLSNFVYLTDAIVGLFIILERGIKGQAYNICNEKETRSVLEIAKLVTQEVAKGTISVRIEPKDNMGYAPDVMMYLDSSKLRKLGWTAEIGISEAYRRLAHYLKETSL